MAGAWGFAFFFFLLKCVRKVRLRHAKMKNIYVDVKRIIEDFKNIFKNTEEKDEKTKRLNQKELEVFQKLERESLKKR
ncbi:hypothetical protein FIM84_07850, partial [Helicobacter pylori]